MEYEFCGFRRHGSEKIETPPFVLLHRALLIASTLGTVSGCGASTANPQYAQVDTVEGVVHVWNPPEGEWVHETAWSSREVFRIGARWSPQEELFSGPLLTTTYGPDGLIYVLDSEASVLSIFSADGTFLRRIGGAGRGPGEFVAPSAIAWDGMDRLWVADGFGGRYTVFDRNGALVRTQPRPVRALARRQHPIYYLEDGTFLDEASSWPLVFFLRVDTSGASVDTLGSLRQPKLSDAAMGVRIPPGSDFQRIVRELQVRRHWAIGSDGTLWVVDSGELRLVQRELAGDTIRIVHTSHRFEEFSSSENRMIDRGLLKVGLNRQDMEVARPIAQGIYVLEDGHVLVHIETEIGEDGKVFDVFDPEGRYLGPLNLPFAPARRGVLTFRGDTILSPTLGRDDVPFVVGAVIERGGRSE